MRFLISGSSNLLLMKKITETLAGRAVYFEMNPMTLGEIRERLGELGNFFNLWEQELRISEQRAEFIDPVQFMFKGFMRHSCIWII